MNGVGDEAAAGRAGPCEKSPTEDDLSLEDDFLENPPTNVGDDFDQIIGELENILVEEDFMKLQMELLEKHWHHFEVHILLYFISDRGCRE